MHDENAEMHLVNIFFLRDERDDAFKIRLDCVMCAGMQNKIYAMLKASENSTLGKSNITK